MAENMTVELRLHVKGVGKSIIGLKIMAFIAWAFKINLEVEPKLEAVKDDN